MRITPRDYQQEAIDVTIADIESGVEGNPLVIAPTGAGKSVMIGGLIKQLLEKNPNYRIMVATHVKELVAQNFKMFQLMYPGHNTGIYAASLNRRDCYQNVLFCSVQSVYAKAEIFGRIDVILVDESHRIPEEGEGTYLTLMKKLKEKAPHLKVIGYTATPYRMKSGSLVGGDSSIFQRICYDKCTIPMLIERGYLCPVVAKNVDNKYDFSKVRITGAEISKAQMDKIVNISAKTKKVIQEIITKGAGRNSWLVFTTSVDHSVKMAEAFNQLGIKAAAVHSKMKGKDRDRIIEMYKCGVYKCLVNCDVLTTGFDAPATDLIAVLRKTMSPGLWVQICGRGMRIHDGKTDCLVLDFGGNTQIHGPIDLIDVAHYEKKKKRKGDAPVKECPMCSSWVAAGAYSCKYCFHEFPKHETEKFLTQARELQLLSWEGNTGHKITSIRFIMHQKPNKKPLIRVLYYDKMKEVCSELIMLEHGKRLKDSADRWWRYWIGDSPPSDTVSAMAILGPGRTLDKAKDAYVYTKPNGKYKDVVGWLYAHSK